MKLLTVILVFFSLVVVSPMPCFAQESLSAKFFEYYNKGKFEEAEQYLQSVAAEKDKNNAWYYYKGLALARLNRHGEAITNLETYVNKGDYSPQKAKAYYYLGLMYFYSGSYELAINSFEVASDLSKDSNLDRILDSQLARAINYRDYFAMQRRFNMGIAFGYYFSSNAIGISPDVSAQNLNGNVFNYGLIAGYKVIDRYNLVVEPNILLYDRYTLDKGFKSVAALQAVDALIAQFSLPVNFFFGRDGSVQYGVALSASNIYLPISTTKRELYQSSLGLKAKIKADLSRNLGTEGTVGYYTDQSSNYRSDALNPTGSHTDLGLGLVHYLNKARNKNLQYQLNYTNKSAKGSDAKYAKTELSGIYNFPGFRDWVNSLSLKLSTISYREQAPSRTDNQGALNYSVTQPVDSGSVNYFIGLTVNNSTLSAMKYNEGKIGAIYSYSFGF